MCPKKQTHTVNLSKIVKSRILRCTQNVQTIENIIKR